MQSLDLARRADADTLLSPQIIDMNAAIRSIYGLPTLVMRWENHLQAVSEGEAGWVYGPIEMDPTTAGGRCVIPSRQRRQLAVLAHRGVPVQRLAIAHEVATMPATYERPRPCTLEEARRLVGPVPPNPRLVRTVRALNALAGAGTDAVAGVATVGARAVAAVLDPIVFGVLAPTQPREGEPAVWIALAAWRW